MRKIVLISLLVSLCFSFSDITKKEEGLHTHTHSHILNQTIHEHTHVDTSSTYYYFSKEEKNFELVVKNSFYDANINTPNPIVNNIFRPPIS